MIGRLGRPSLLGLLLVVGVVGAATAQDRPVVFVHGLASNADGWSGTATDLTARLAIAPHLPTQNWRDTYEAQADGLRGRAELAGLGPSMILIGHSNGGLVSREWSRRSAVAGVITVGTPHRGAPVLPNFFQWVGFQASTPPLLNNVLAVFRRSSSWDWVFAYAVNALNWMSDFGIWSVYHLAPAIGVDVLAPITSQMHPASGYLAGINASNNVNREAASLGTRVGLVSVAHNFYWAGPARVIVPDAADAVATALYGSAFGLLYWGTYIIASADPTDMRAFDQGVSLWMAGGQLLSVDPFYCRLISSLSFNACIENDGIVPFTSQEYPGAVNLYLGADNNGPSHVQERQRGADALYAALVWYGHVPPRAAPAPPGAPGSGPGSEGSGKGPASPAEGPMVLQPDQLLHPGEGIDSGDGRYHFTYQQDGNLVLYDDQWSPMWASGTDGTEPGVLVMQGDGNLVIYDGQGTAVWASGSSFGHAGAWLIVQDDGNVVIYNVNAQPVWATGTTR